jgi:hypothetical protein
MARPNVFTNDELVMILAKIEKIYGYIDLHTVNRAHSENPYEYPSYKIFERRLGGMKTINTPDFRNKLKVFSDKLKN